MIIIIIVIFIFLFIIGKITINDRISSIFLNLYLIWWLLLLIISSFNPYDLYAVSDKIYFLILLSITFFCFGFVLNNYSKKAKFNLNIQKEDLMLSYEKISKNNFFRMTIIFLSVLIASYNIKYQQYILLYGVEEARTLRFYVGPIFNTNAEIFFYNFFVESFSILVSFYLAFSLVWLKFNKTFLFSLLFVYFFSSFGAGRFYLIETAFLIAFLFLIKSKVSNNSKSDTVVKRNNLLLLFVLIPFVIAIYIYSIFLSNFRKGVFELNIDTIVEGNDDFFSQIITYCVGSFRALEYGIVNYTDKIGYTYGSLSFGGLDEIIGVTLNIFGIKYEYSNLLYGDYTSKFFNIGYENTYNALFTNVFGQYLDFGYLGVIILSFFWGIMFNKVVLLYIKTNSVYILLIMSYLFVVLIMSPMTWKLQSPSIWVFMFTVYVLYKKSKSKIIS